MELSRYENELLQGKHGRAAGTCMKILVALGKIYGAGRLIPVASVQVAGVSYDNLGDAGLHFLEELAEDGRAQVLATLNPAGMDIENWRALGIDAAFAAKQTDVLQAFARMGLVATCTCTPYFTGNLPRFGEHLAWSESSAVCFANSVLGARTNREGGPSALAAALTGRTPEYGLHLASNRMAEVLVEVEADFQDETDFGVLGQVVGNRLGHRIPLFRGCGAPSVDMLKSLAASIATYGGTAMFLMEGITPDPAAVPREAIRITGKDLAEARQALNDDAEVDFVSLGCPHLSLDEVRRIAGCLDGKQVTREMWLHVARPVKKIADMTGYTRTIEASGAIFACDTCMVVAPLKGRFRCLATNSAKCVFYGRGRHDFKVVFRPLEECLRLACT